MIGQLYTAMDGTGTWMVVAIVQQAGPRVLVLEYQTVASESNWYGTEGYVLVQDNENNALLTDGADQTYTPIPK